MEKEKRRKPTAVFMAFGTKGDVHPIAAIAAAFACEQKQYHRLNELTFCDFLDFDSQG
ncbi:hypothetical protein L1049_015207 [Liquidambar formosana]|uniref:Uncharacterized protein n=1 Tax=Liquidambar formosana TaxID=63359 RepID=A0AAP0S4E0_LIQFO